MLTNLADAFETVARALGDRAAVVEGDTVLSWAALDAAAGRFAQYVAAEGVRPGDRVAIALRNRPEYLVALLGSLKAAAVPVNVNHRYREAELRYVIADSGARLAVHEADLGPAFEAVAAQESGLLGHLAAGAAEPDWQAVVREGHTTPHIRRPDADWLLYTGGTTGQPKAVLTKHSNVLRAVTSVARRAYGEDALGPRWPGRAEDLGGWLSAQPFRVVMLAMPPFMHATGLYNALGTLLAGGVVIMLPPGPYQPATAARVIADHAVTDLVIVGDVMGAPLVDALDEAQEQGRPYDVSSLRRVVSSGVRWGLDTKQRLLRHADCTLYDILAATEGGPYALHVSSRRLSPASAGLRLAPGARLIDDNGQDVQRGSGQPGLLAAPMPPGVQYVGDSPTSGGAFRAFDGVWHSVPGDLAVIGADGCLQLLGRGSAVVNTGGEKVYAEEVEGALREHPGIVDAVVVGVPDRLWGEVIVAVAVSATDPSPALDDVRTFLSSRLAGYKAPRAVCWVPALRRTGAGKIDLRWARTVAAGEQRP